MCLGSGPGPERGRWPVVVVMVERCASGGGERKDRRQAGSSPGPLTATPWVANMGRTVRKKRIL
jgi:hypothetical protein